LIFLVRAAVREEETMFRKAAAEGCNLLPLKRSIFSDHLTPVLAYRCLVKEDDREAPSFLFESVEQGSEGTNVVRSVYPRHPSIAALEHFIEHVTRRGGTASSGRSPPWRSWPRPTT
jgi:hypothetical protein